MNKTILAILKQADSKPEYQNIFSTKHLWTDPHISRQMLSFHLDPGNDAASYRHDTINSAVKWMYDSFLAEKDHPAYLDLGCGPGMYTSAISKKIAQNKVQKDGIVKGVDWSMSSLDYARMYAADNKLDISYIQNNYLELSMQDKFDLVSLISCDICALSLKNVLKVFDFVRSILKPDSVFIFDFHSLRHFSTRTEYSKYDYFETDSFYSTGKHAVLEKRFRYEEQNGTLDKYTIIKEHDIDEMYIWHTFYSIESMTKLLEQCGLEVIGSYGSITGEAYNSDSMNPAIAAKLKS